MSREAEEYYREENKERIRRRKRRARKRIFDGIEMIAFGIVITGVGGYLTYAQANSPINPSMDAGNILIIVAGIIVILLGIARVRTRNKE